MCYAGGSYRLQGLHFCIQKFTAVRQVSLEDEKNWFVERVRQNLRLVCVCPIRTRHCGHKGKTSLTCLQAACLLLSSRQTLPEEACKLNNNLLLLHQSAAAGVSPPFNAAAKQHVLASLLPSKVMCCSSLCQPCVQATLPTTNFIAHILHQKFCSFIGDLYAAQIQDSITLPQQTLMVVLHQMR